MAYHPGIAPDANDISRALGLNEKYEFNVVGATHADIVSADQRGRRLILVMIGRDGSLGRWWGICSHSVSLGDGGSVGGSYVSPRGFPPSGQGERGMGGGGEIGWGARWRWSMVSLS